MLMFFFEKRIVLLVYSFYSSETRNDFCGAFFVLKKTTGGPRLGFGS